MRITKEQTFAVCIDYQERLLPAMREQETLLSNTCKLLRGLKVLDIPVFLTQQYTKGLGMTVPSVTEAADTAEYLDKLSFGAWPVLKDAVPSPEVRPYVLVCGIESHICVLRTAIELKEQGYQPLLVVDSMSSRKSIDHDIALLRAQQEGILLTTTEAALFELLGQAGTPESKQIQRIIR